MSYLVQNFQWKSCRQMYFRSQKQKVDINAAPAPAHRAETKTPVSTFLSKLASPLPSSVSCALDTSQVHSLTSTYTLQPPLQETTLRTKRNNPQSPRNTITARRCAPHASSRNNGTNPPTTPSKRSIRTRTRKEDGKTCVGITEEREASEGTD